MNVYDEIFSKGFAFFIENLFFVFTPLFVKDEIQLVRGHIHLKVDSSYCVKTEHLLRTQHIPNERYIHKEQKSVS